MPKTDPHIGTGQKMSHCCTTFSGLWGPPFCRGHCLAKHA